MTEAHEDLEVIQDSKPERNNQALFKSLYQGTKDVLRKMCQRSCGKNGS